jgi:hypothetical protein
MSVPHNSESVPGTTHRAHFVELYDADGSALACNIGRYLLEGLHRGEGLLVIAGREHAAAFRAEFDRLGGDSAAAERNGRLVILDAQQTLDRFMVNDRPDAELFRATATAALRSVRRAGGGLRAYGEMVGILWEAGNTEAAVELEGFWNRLLAETEVDLYCAYPIDVFGSDFHAAVVDEILCTHTHLVPSAGTDLERAIERAMSDVLGSRAEGLRPLIKANHRPAWAAVPPGETVILWLRNNLPDYADEIVGRARRYYQAYA